MNSEMENKIYRNNIKKTMEKANVTNEAFSSYISSTRYTPLLKRIENELMDNLSEGHEAVNKIINTYFEQLPDLTIKIGKHTYTNFEIYHYPFENEFEVEFENEKNESCTLNVEDNEDGFTIYEFQDNPKSLKTKDVKVIVERVLTESKRFRLKSLFKSIK